MSNLKTKNSFDTVKMMRKIRDEFSKEIMDMSYQEEREYLDKLFSKKYHTSEPNNHKSIEI